MHPSALLQKLIQFDTTNPPGNELGCQQFIQRFLADAGLESRLFARVSHRPNLIARLKGRGSSPPLLFYGHIDVATTEKQHWSVPPFEGRVQDGFVWGRGALDMKGGVAMMLTAFARAASMPQKPHGDVILAIVCDEENGGEFGAKYLVEHHAAEFRGVRHAIGECGGFSTTIDGHRFYPIQVAEKQPCRIRATLRGPEGHGSMPVSQGAMAKLGRFLQLLHQRHLPVHITPIVRRMFKTMAETVGGMNRPHAWNRPEKPNDLTPLSAPDDLNSLSGLNGLNGRGAPDDLNARSSLNKMNRINSMILRMLVKPRLADIALRLMGDQGRDCYPLIRHTVVPTIVRGGSDINVIPGEVAVELDGRILPGFKADDLLHELRELCEFGLKNEVEFEVLNGDPGPAKPDLALLDTLAKVLRALDPAGIPVPMMLSGTTDARFFSRLGIQTYGFLPMRLPQEFPFSSLFHAPDERIPLSALTFGTTALENLLQQSWEC